MTKKRLEFIFRRFFCFPIIVTRFDRKQTNEHALLIGFQHIRRCLFGIEHAYKI